MTKVPIIALALAGPAYAGMVIYVVMALNMSREPLVAQPEILFEDVIFNSRKDSLALTGWYFPGGEHAVIVVNGGTQNRVDPVIDTLKLTEDLVNRGFSVLLFDLRGRGNSEGRARSLVHSDRDIGGAIDFIHQKGHEVVSILGFSTGAAGSIVVGNEVNSLVLDSCFASVYEMSVNILERGGYPRFIAHAVTPGALAALWLIYDYKSIGPENAIADLSSPVLIIHGDADEDIPPDNAERLYEAAPNPQNEIWIVPEAGHATAYPLNPVQYMDRVTAFLRRVET